MKKLLQIALGVLTAIGGFVDIGDFVTSAVVGARFGMSLAWAILVGTLGIVVYAEMSGRVAALTKRAVFDVVRERLGVRFAMANLFSAYFINLLTLTAELAGVAIAIELATSVNYLLWVPIVGLVVWLVVWKLPFEVMENAFGMLGLCLLVFIIALWQLGPDWSGMLDHASHPTVPQGEGHPTWWYYAIGLFGAAMTPYEVFFFSSGAVEERWGRQDLITNRLNVFVGFPLGAAISLSIMACSALVLGPLHVEVSHVSQVGLPIALALGKLGVAAMLVGFFAATFGASLETLLSAGYTFAQYFGWTWGKAASRPREASRFQTVLLISLFAAMALALTTIDPVKVTEYSVVLSAAALPLTYFPILVIANDRGYMGDKANGWFSNTIATGYLVIIVAVTLVTLPLMIATKAGM
ncbi:MAG: manganese transport protein [Frankiales bacterium]|nr:manganese transport protein [Frankiales bacterium]